jgi:ketosteroid isomerase-like protein
MSSVDEATQTQVDDLGRKWAEAELRGDVDRLAAFLADDFVCVGPLGFVLDKQHYLGPRQSGDLQHTSFDWSDVRVRRYGLTAVAIGTQMQKSTFQGRDASGQFRVTMLAVQAQAQDHWRIVGLHLSPIAQPAGR